MPYAALSIDLKANLASLQSGMDKAVRLAERDAARLEKAFAGVRIAAGAIGGALIGSLAGAGFSQFLIQTNDALLAIKDLAEGTGSTVENVSALENALRLNNRTLAEAQPILVKFNGALKEADGKNGISQALNAIGLSAADLRKQDPVAALRSVAQALQGYADDGNKARIVQELFGKSVADVLPLLNDLADTQAEATKGIREATEEADKFEKNLARLKTQAADLARTLAGPVVAGLNKMFEVLRGSPQTDLELTRRQISILTDYINANGAIPSIVMRRKELIDQEQRLLGALPSGGRRPPNEGGGGLATLRNLPDLAGGGRSSSSVRSSRSAAAAAGLFVGPEVPDSLRDALRAIEQTDVSKIAALQAQLQELLSIRAAGGETPALAEAITDVSLAVDELNSKSFVPAVDAKNDFLRSEKAGYEETEEFMRRMKDEAKKLDDVASDLGFTFSSAFEDAIVGGKGLREVLRGIEQDILRIITRQLVTEPLGNAITGIIKGAFGGGGSGGGGIGDLFGNLLGSLFGGFFAGGGYLPPGKWGVAGERGPEPIFGGRTGLTVQPSGGRSITVNVSMPPGSDRRTGQQFGADIARAISRASSRNG
jgi:hypothetical protein